MVDLEKHVVDLYDNDLENHMVYADDVIVKRCVEPKKRVPPRGTVSLGSIYRFIIASST